MTAQVATAFVGHDELSPVTRRIDANLSRLAQRFESVRGRFTTGLVNRAGARAYDLLERSLLRIARIIPDLIGMGTRWTGVVDQLGDVSGMTAAQASELAAVAEGVGVSAGSLGRAFNVMARSVARTPEAFERFGIAIKDANGNLLDGYQIFQNARTRLASMTDGVRRADLAQRIFGRGSLELMDVLTLTSGAYRAQADEARRSGLVITDAGLAAAEQLDRVRGRLSQAVTGVGTQVLVGVAPALDALVTGVTRTIQANMANIVRFVAGVVNFVAGAIGQVTGLDLSPVTTQAEGAVKSFAEWKRDMGLMPAVATRARAGIDRVTSGIDAQVKAIDRQLAAMDRADRSEQARRDYQAALRDVRDARRELEDVRGETILASRMSEADAVLARQDRAARMAQAARRLRDAEAQAEDVARRNRGDARRQALQAERDRLAAISSAAGGSAGGGGVVGAVTGSLRSQYQAYVRSMRRGTKDLKTSLVTGLDGVARDAQAAGARVADAIQDAIFGPDTRFTDGGGVTFTVRSGGLIGALQGLASFVSRLVDLVAPNTDAILKLAAAIAAWKVGGAVGGVLGGLLGPGAAGAAGAAGAGSLLAAGLLVSEAFKGAIQGVVPSTPNSRRISAAHPFGTSALWGGEGPDALVAGLVESLLPGWLVGDRGALDRGMLLRSGGFGAARGRGTPASSRGAAADPLAFLLSKGGGRLDPYTNQWVMPGVGPGLGMADPLVGIRTAFRPILGAGSPVLDALQAARTAQDAAAAAGRQTADNTDPLGSGRLGIQGVREKVRVKVDSRHDFPSLDVNVRYGRAGTFGGELERSSLARSLVRIASDTAAIRRYGVGVYFVKPPSHKPPSSSTKP